MIFHIIIIILFLLVDRSSWEQLIGLYPHLVDCTTTASVQVTRSLREALLQYTDLLQPPIDSSQTIVWPLNRPETADSIGSLENRTTSECSYSNGVA